ncbi:uncharacterized protein LOC134208987 [Armigeres subalbatus]|uniref:uncharacterized protein LOC134208987 n=1 Tax=Armigeres subalbatus TaxID=124917 RepID=UPI002ED58F07
MLPSAVFLVIVAFIVVLTLFEWHLRQRDGYRAARQYPGGTMLPVLGNIMEVLFKDSVQIFNYARSKALKHGQSYRQWIFGYVILNVIRLREAEIILSSTKHTRKSVLYRFLEPLMGDGLLCSKGSKWQARRKILTPAFHFNILTNFLQVFQEEAMKLVGILNAFVESGEEVVLQSIVTRFTLNTICETAMGVKLDSYNDADKYRSQVYDVGEKIVHRTTTPWLYYDGIYNLLGYQKPLEDAIVPIHDFTRNIIQQKREQLKRVSALQDTVADTIYGSKQRYAMLNTLLMAEANDAIDEEGIREEVDTFMFEGHDTTAGGLIFSILLMATEQEAQQRVYDELLKAHRTKPEHEAFTIADYNNLKYLDRFVKEALRLYPPVSFISRNLTGPLNIDSTSFPHGTVTHIHIYDLHRDPEQFPDPERFDPDRFLPEVTAKRNPYAYVPFSAGPRNCIGQKYALLEMKTVLCTLLMNFHILPVTERHQIVFTADLVLRAKTPIKIRLAKRESSVTHSSTTYQWARKWAKRYGGSYWFWFNSDLFVLNVIRVREAEPILSSTKNIDKSRFYEFLHPFLGLGLLNSSGPKWMHRRRILTPSFHFNILNGFHQTFVEECDQMLATLDDHANRGVSTALQSIMSKFTLNTICETSMGVKLSKISGAEEYRTKLYEIGEALVHRLMRPWLLSNSINRLMGYKTAFDKLLLPVHSFTTSIINMRRAQFQSEQFSEITEENIYLNPKKRYAMLDSLLLAEQKQLIDEEGIREEVDTFTFEGHDTTAAALTFIFFTLAREQKVQDRIYSEVVQIYNSKPHSDHSFTPQDYNEMKFLDRALKECLRLWPPVTFISRNISEDIVLDDGSIIPAGCVANIHIMDLHHDPEQYPDPERFDADRFLPEEVDRRNPYAYVPFSAGPRNCIGQKYAMMELKAVVVNVLLRFRVLPVTRLEEINFVADLVLRSTNPIEVKFERR